MYDSESFLADTRWACRNYHRAHSIRTHRIAHLAARREESSCPHVAEMKRSDLARLLFNRPHLLISQPEARLLIALRRVIDRAILAACERIERTLSTTNLPARGALAQSRVEVHTEVKQAFDALRDYLDGRTLPQAMSHRAVPSAYRLMAWVQRQLAIDLARDLGVVDASLLDVARRLEASTPTYPTRQILTLTERERQILTLTANGITATKAQAQALELASTMVAGSWKRLYEKLGVHSRVQAVLVARQLGALPDE